jgi:hypothetical protein
MNKTASAQVRPLTKSKERIMKWNDRVMAEAAATQEHVIQFNWRRHWKKKVEPFLKYEEVQFSLDIGMQWLYSSWQRGDAPYRLGGYSLRLSSKGNDAGLWVPQRIVQGKLSWYSPLGRCHWIAFFAIAIGVLNYPDLDWRFMSGDLHTVPVGFDANGKPHVVMDILLFDKFSGAQSIANTRRTRVNGALSKRARAQWNEVYSLFVERVVPAIRAAALLKHASSDLCPETYARGQH